MIWLTSDWHFCHNKPFLYEPRGFTNIYDMNEAIITRHNSLVNPEDDVYCLGDCMLMDNDTGLKCIKALKGKIHIIRGNHCTDNRIELYKSCYNVVEVCDVKILKFSKTKKFYLSHYPTFTANYDDDKKPPLINLHGHTHLKEKFFNNNPYMYNVGMDSHNCYPVDIETILNDINNFKKEI